MSEQETIEEFAARMGAYYKARKEYPWEELCAKYRGKYFAWYMNPVKLSHQAAFFLGRPWRMLLTLCRIV
jgi:hypothetical protein